MKKMDRRDYLLRMGAGAAGILGATNLDILGQRRSKPSATSSQTQAASTLTTSSRLKWPVTPTKPSLTPFVTGFFCGLIGFCFDDTDSADRFVDVGFHRGDNKHQLEITIYKITSTSGCRDIVKQFTPTGTSLEFGLRPHGPGPNVFQTNGPFDRNRIGDPYDYDFRWLPDLDGADFYPENYGKFARYPVRLKVTDGTFYTRIHTKSTFQLVDVDRQDCDMEIRDFGHVALYMAVAIDTQSTVFLSEADPLVWQPNVRYQVVFRNECDDCSYDVNDCDAEKNRNDFHFNRKVVKVPSGRMKYGLRLKQSCSPDCNQPDFCYPGPHRLTDEAPCMGGAFGQTGGFP